MNRPVVIIGSGGHAAVIADALLASSRQVIGCTDADPARHGATACGVQVLGDDSVLVRWHPDEIELANGIGGSRGEPLRGEIQRRFEAQGWRFATVVHPQAVVSRFAAVAASAQVMAGAVVQPGSRIGVGCIVNTGAVVEHDVHLGSFVHVACNAVLCGNVRVGTHSHIGAGAVVRQGVDLGEWTVVGAGAVVLRGSQGGSTLMGVPATERMLKK